MGVDASCNFVWLWVILILKCLSHFEFNLIMVIRVGKDSGEGKPKEHMPEDSEKKKAHFSIREREYGPMSTIKTKDGLEDPDNVIFGAIRSDLYVVEPDDSRPRRIDRVAPPGKPREGALYLGEARKFLKRKGSDNE